MSTAKSWYRDSNSEPTDYKSDAQPIVLYQHLFIYSPFTIKKSRDISHDSFQTSIKFNGHGLHSDNPCNLIISQYLYNPHFNFPDKNLNLFPYLSYDKRNSGSVENRTPYAHRTFLLGCITNSLPKGERGWWTTQSQDQYASQYKSFDIRLLAYIICLSRLSDRPAVIL